jgi:UDP-2,3-diacylglucosamine hydrolase
MDVTPSAVAAAFREHRADRMIHGHTHRPAHHTQELDGRTRERIVLSDWHDRGHYLAVDAQGARDHDIEG